MLFGLILLAGCSVKKAAFTSDNSGVKRSVIVSDVAALNYTAQPFFISRAEINLVAGNESQKLISTIRFAQPDSFLISVRTFTGIEAARILLTKDSVLVNDRINRVLYLGSQDDVKQKYGFDIYYFPVLLGDLITNSPSTTALGKPFSQRIGGADVINYFVNDQNLKAEKITLGHEFWEDNISISFADFGKEGKMIFPQDIRIDKFANFDRIEIKIKKIEFNTDSKITFIPGRNFSRVKIK